MTEAAIEEYLDHMEEGEEDASVIEIYEDLIPAFEIYGRCPLQVLAGGMSMVFRGVSIADAVQVAGILGYTMTADLLDDVQRFGHAVSSVLNKRKK